MIGPAGWPAGKGGPSPAIWKSDGRPAGTTTILLPPEAPLRFATGRSAKPQGAGRNLVAVATATQLGPRVGDAHGPSRERRLGRRQVPRRAIRAPWSPATGVGRRARTAIPGRA